MEKRAHPRIPYKFRAYDIDTGREITFESEDISAGGLYLHGDPRVPVGGRLWIRMELVVTRDGKEWIFPVDAEVEVVRLTRGPSGEVIGFGARWRSVVSHKDMEPLREFLKNILGMSCGFVQTLPPRNELDSPSYVFVFSNEPSPPKAETVEGPKTSQEGAPVSILDNPGAFLDRSKGSPQSLRTGIYVILPMTYRIDGDEYEARAVKLREHGMRIATTGPLPEIYRRVTVRIPVTQRNKKAFIEIVCTVTAVKGGSNEGEGQFEVEFGLSNNPESLAMYRKILDRLNQTLSQSRGF